MFQNANVVATMHAAGPQSPSSGTSVLYVGGFVVCGEGVVESVDWMCVVSGLLVVFVLCSVWFGEGVVCSS